MCFACLRPCEAVWLVCVACGIMDVMIAILNIRLGGGTFVSGVRGTRLVFEVVDATQRHPVLCYHHMLYDGHNNEAMMRMVLELHILHKKMVLFTCCCHC